SFPRPLYGLRWLYGFRPLRARRRALACRRLLLCGRLLLCSCRLLALHARFTLRVRPALYTRLALCACFALGRLLRNRFLRCLRLLAGDHERALLRACGARLARTGLRELLGDRGTQVRGTLDRAHACALQGCELLRGRSLTARHDGARVSHPLARRRSDAGNVGDDRFGHVLANELGGRFFIAAADLADHDDAFRLRIFFEACEHIDEIHASHGIAADADAGALSETDVRRLEYGFVRERARTRDDADLAGLVNEAGHDADLAFPGRDDAGAIRPNQQTAIAAERGLHAHHVVHRNAFGDADDQLDARIGRFEDRIGSERCRHVDHADRRARCGDRLACRVEDGKIQVFLAAATRRDAADELRAVGDALLGMERALLAGEALTDYASGFVDKNGHGMRL